MAINLACEGGVQLYALPCSTGPTVRYLPAPLIRARAEALNPRNCLDLGRTARQALYGILAFFDIRKPDEPVFASREKLCAEALLGSQPTLYRALADLVTRGYIRREQGRRLGKETYGQYSVSRIWLEEKALALLGLDGKKPPKNGPNQDKKPAVDNTVKEDGVGQAKDSFPQGPSIKVRGRLQDSELSPSKHLSSKEQPPRKARGQDNQGRAGGSSENIDRKTRLPAELVRLMELGLSKSRICALMKLAREHGNGGKLGAVVQLVWDRIRQLHRNAAFAYLAKLVQQRKDYGRLVEIQDLYEDKNRMPKAVAERYAEKLKVLLERAKGMVVVARNGFVLGPVIIGADGTGRLEFVTPKGVRSTRVVNFQFVREWEEGDLMLRSPDSLRSGRSEDEEYGD